MRILLSNDDGYQALGVQTLYEVLLSHGHEVFLVAPSGQRSAQSHSMSFYQAVQVNQMTKNIYSVSGTPADCVAIGLSCILKHNPPDFVVSGINHGLNVGVDVNYSGTVGAATEACLLGYKSIAVSLDSDNNPNAAKDFVSLAQVVQRVLAFSDKIPWPPSEVLNINSPPSPELNQMSVAQCNGEALYVPHVEEITSKFQEHVKLYLIGGMSRVISTPSSQDVSLIGQGRVTLSFLKARQSSSASQPILENLVKQILS